MTTVLNSTNWMQGIDDNTLISTMSIPGTHESCALYGGGQTQCQELSISDQLRRGIRFLDIRCAYAYVPIGVNNNALLPGVDSSQGSSIFDHFPIFHGGIPQRIDFLQVQKACIEFLDANPFEFILMNVQHEDIVLFPSRPDHEFRDQFMKLYDPNYWEFYENIPTLKDCRKKIILIRPGWPRLTGNTGSGLEWNGYNIDGTSDNAIFDTQNGWKKYNTGSWGQQNAAKATAVKEYLRRASTKAAGDKIYLNFLSRAAGAYVGTAAQVVNLEIAGYLHNATGSPLGVLPIDFTGNTGWTGSLEEQIVQRNTFKSGFSVQFTVSPFKVGLSVPGRPSDKWWMSAGQHDWAVATLPMVSNVPTADSPMILELYTYEGKDYFKAPGVESYLSVSNAGQVGLYGWNNARTFSSKKVIVTVDNQTFEIVCLVSDDNGHLLRRHSNGELWCDENEVGDLLSVTLAPPSV